MNKGLIIGIIGGIIALVVIYFIFQVTVTNSIIAKQEKTTAQWADVESAYQRRADLIPNLVNTVKGYADFEQETLTQVIEARSNATSINVDANNLNPAQLQKFQAAQEQLSGALSRLLVTVERYPELKANQNFLALQSQLEGTENRINVERNRFNEVVQNYNTYIKTFPGSMFADGYEEKGYFESTQGSEVAPEVTF